MSTPDASIDRVNWRWMTAGVASLGMSFVAACIPVVFHLALGQRAARHSIKENPA